MSASRMPPDPAADRIAEYQAAYQEYLAGRRAK